jgi:thiamine biosynthesis lipoprotein
MMGMPITLDVIGAATADILERVFDYFEYVDRTFSTYKHDSEISRINRRELPIEQASADMRTIFRLAEETKRATAGYFDIARDGEYDPSGIVKGWAIQQAAEIIAQHGYTNFYVEAGGDIQIAGSSGKGQKWRVGIRNPFNINQIVKVLAATDCGVATSGTSIRGQHIYDPHTDAPLDSEIVSITVIGPNIYEADRFATAAFAMGRAGIMFVEQLAGLEGYAIDRHGQATLTSSFARYVSNDELH